MKITKKELNTIIMETVYEMLQEKDEVIITLMREMEGLHGEVEGDINEWVETTSAIIAESIDVEVHVPDLITEENIKMLHLANVLVEGVDKDAATELEIYIDNEAQLYNQQYLPILKNLSRKSKAGKYDQKLAIKGWMHLVDTGAKKYAKDQGGGSTKWNDMFNKATRMAVATSLEDTNRDAIESGEYL